MNKLAQTNIIAFIAIVVGLFILAPIMLKIVNSTLDPLEDTLNNSNVEAGERVGYIHDVFLNFWDYTIALAFLVNIISMLIFAFLVDSHPIFSILYMISLIFTFMFSHYVVIPVTTILGMEQFATEVTQLPIVNFIVLRFDLILLGLAILTGIIMYSKFRGNGGGITR